MDDISNMSRSKGKIEVIKPHDQDKSCHEEACSPFCQCACCAGFSVNHFIASITFVPPYQGRSVFAYLPSDVLDIALPIWQPPQLV